MQKFGNINPVKDDKISKAGTVFSFSETDPETMPFTLDFPACLRKSQGNRRHFWLTIAPLIAGLLGAGPVGAVSLSAYYNNNPPFTNSMGLLPKSPVGIFQPGVAQCLGGATLVAPGFNSFLSASNTYIGCNWGTVLNPAFMGGDAVATITNLGSNSYDLSLKLTNFTLNSTSVPPLANEYVYINLWENIVGLPGGSTAIWSGVLSANGTYNRTTAGEILGIEPIATVFDSGITSWVPASNFFGGIPPGLSGPFSASTSVVNLTPYVFGGGNLRVGVETILLLRNLDGIGGDQINLPTSLELTMHLQDPAPPAPNVPAPLAALGAAAGWGWSRRLRRRCLASTLKVASQGGKGQMLPVAPPTVEAPSNLI